MVLRHHRCVIALLAVFIATTLSAAIPERERNALLAIYNGTNGSAWTDHTGWNGAAGTECQWFGVACDDAQSTVTGLALGNNGLAGALPNALGDLTNLQELYLYENNFTGSIPDSIGKLTKLRILELEKNGFSGTIPSALGSLAALTDLFAYSNQLSGAIPSELGALAQLERLGLEANQLTGSLPAALGQLRNLELLDVSGNHLAGTIPKEIGNASQMIELDLAGNQLSGAIPVELFSLSNLQALNLEQNQLSGTLPADLAKLQNLQRLVLWGNQLTGPIPPQITTMTALQRVEVSINQFSGTIPADIDRLQNLQSLEVGQNALEGTIPAGIGNLRDLRVLILDRNKLTGTIPAGISNLTALEILILAENDFTGTIPDLRNLTNLRELYLGTTRLSGPIPDMFGQMSKLQIVFIDNTFATGAIPPSLTAATTLTAVDLAYNQLTGSIPAGINKLTKLQYLTLSYNPMSGPIPDGLWDLRELLDIRLAGLHLEGTLPARIGNLTKLENLDLNENELTGVIPPQIGDLSALLDLNLGGNRFSGSVPPELARLTKLLQIDIYGNNLSGPMPPDLAKMTSLIDGGSVFQYNALYTTDASLREFLNRKQYDHDWESTQTVVPANVRVTATTDRNATIEWTPISYQWDDGGYQVRASLSPGGNAVSIVTTLSKEITSTIVRGLQPSTTYSISVAAVTYPHDTQHNLLISPFAAPVQITTGPRLLAPPDVVVTADPRGLVQIDGVAQNEDNFAITNYGDTATFLTLTKNEAFFTIAPETFALAAGATQTITVKSVKQPVGTYWGWVDISGEGAKDLGVSISLLSATRPPGSVIAEPLTARVEITGVPGSDSIGTVNFRNTGTATLTGIAVSDVPWIVPRTDPITIDPNASGSVTFTVDRSRRPSATGALTGTLSLIYVAGTSGNLLMPRADGTPPSYSISIVTVVDTAKPQVAPGTIPPLAAKEVAYFIPGLTSAQKSYGNVVSDVSLVNAFGSKAIDDLKMYFTPAASSQSVTASLASIAGNQSMTMANIVTNVYASSNPMGTLQVRSGDWQKLVVTAKLLCVAKSGTYSGDVPVFRSDRSVAAGAQMDLAGLRRSATLHTTIYLQETSGSPANVHIDFLNASGGTVEQRDVAMSAFGFEELAGGTPEGAASAVVTNTTGSVGRITAYGRVVDETSGDSWSVVDWTRYYDFLQSEAVRIPLAQSSGSSKTTRRRAVRHDAGAVAAASAQTKTELTLFNPATTESRARVRYSSGSGAYDKDVSLAARQTLQVSDAAAFAGAPPGSGAASVLITPTRGKIVATSRISTASASGSYSAGIPVVPAQSGLRVGQSQIFSGLEDSTSATVNVAMAGTYRTGYGFIETAGAPVTLTVTLLLSDGRSLVSAVVTRQFDLSAGQLMLVNDMVRSVIGETRDAKYPDLHNLQLQIDVTAGSGAVVPFVILIDNATGDSLLRLE